MELKYKEQQNEFQIRKLNVKVSETDLQTSAD